jgi:hypothetical protein
MCSQARCLLASGGSDTCACLLELWCQGGENRVATYPVDYVGSFLIDGLCIKINNLWRHENIAAGDDVGLVLTETTDAERSIMHVLTSGARAHRQERTHSEKKWWYLAPRVIKYEHNEVLAVGLHVPLCSGTVSSC